MLDSVNSELAKKAETVEERLARLERLEAAVAVVLHDFKDPAIVARYLTTLLDRPAPVVTGA